MGVEVLAVVFFCAISATIAPAQTTTPQTSTPIDRHALVTRHNIEVHAIDPNGAMAVGNGDFAFNFDVTGLQSFPEYYATLNAISVALTAGLTSTVLRSSRYRLMSRMPTGTFRFSRLSIFAESRCASGTPRRRMPIKAS